MRCSAGYHAHYRVILMPINTSKKVHNCVIQRGDEGKDEREAMIAMK